MTRNTRIVVLAAVAAFALFAQKGGILHPEMAVQTGSYDKPAATLGTKPSDPWTATTIGAGVGKMPQKGKPVTVIGEIVDFSCYLQLGKHGEAHRSCGPEMRTRRSAHRPVSQGRHALHVDAGRARSAPRRLSGRQSRRCRTHGPYCGSERWHGIRRSERISRDLRAGHDEVSASPNRKRLR